MALNHVAVGDAITASGYNTLIDQSNQAYTTLTALNAVTGSYVGQIAIVTSDPVATNNGQYSWTGSAWQTNTIHFVLTKTAAFTFPTSLTSTTWDSTLFDGVLSGFTTPDYKTFTCSRPGTYAFAMQITYAAGSGTASAIWLRNGTNTKGFTSQASTSGFVGGAWTQRLAAGDTFVTDLISTSGVTGTAIGYDNWLCVDYLHT